MNILSASSGFDRSGPSTCKRLHYCVAISLALVLPPVAQIAAAAPGTVTLAPHRAVYDMVLNPVSGSGQSAAGKGRMVYEIRGAACKGYSISMRWVTERGGTGDGGGLEDLQYVSWEAGNGDNFTFSSTRYVDRRIVEEMEASATKGKDGGPGKIELNTPKKAVAVLPAGTIFPTEHVRMVIADALAGKTVRNDRVYDVSDDGTSIYNTFALITPLPVATRAEGLAKVPSLSEVQGWSANISYFLKGEESSGEEVPDFEQTFALFANGVSTHMRLGTPNVIIEATLNQIEFLPKVAC
ncbi:hypothetical protein MNBD_ALPHA09-1140 [hydrothermal vent metagenome]|uniref:ATP/GTP-binding site motif A n=1 Tax=hydrothermal vent metagenome TaxID=652676 RepID=A0A3B0TT77_9ZZZZ